MTKRQYEMICALKYRKEDPFSWQAAREIERLVQVLHDIRKKILDSEEVPE